MQLPSRRVANESACRGEGPDLAVDEVGGLVEGAGGADADVRCSVAATNLLTGAAGLRGVDRCSGAVDDGHGVAEGLAAEDGPKFSAGAEAVCSAEAATSAIASDASDASAAAPAASFLR